MSYILDALRKSDQQRRRGAPPTLLAAHAAPVETRRRALVWYGLFALVLVSAGVAIGLTRPGQRRRKESPSRSRLFRPRRRSYRPCRQRRPVRTPLQAGLPQRAVQRRKHKKKGPKQ